MAESEIKEEEITEPENPEVCGTHFIRQIIVLILFFWGIFCFSLMMMVS